MKRLVCFLLVCGSAMALPAAATPTSCRFDDIVAHIHQVEADPNNAALMSQEYDLRTYGYNEHLGKDTTNGLRLGDCAAELLFPKRRTRYPAESRKQWQNHFDYAWNQGYDNDSFVADGMMMLGGCATGACYFDRAEIFIGRDGTAVAAMSTVEAFDLLPGETRPPGDHPKMYRSILGIRKGYDTPEVRRFIAKALDFENGPAPFFDLKQGDQHRLSITEIPQD